MFTLNTESKFDPYWILLDLKRLLLRPDTIQGNGSSLLVILVFWIFQEKAQRKVFILKDESSKCDHFQRSCL